MFLYVLREKTCVIDIDPITNLLEVNKKIQHMIIILTKLFWRFVFYLKISNPHCFQLVSLKLPNFDHLLLKSFLLSILIRFLQTSS